MASRAGANCSVIWLISRSRALMVMVSSAHRLAGEPGDHASEVLEVGVDLVEGALGVQAACFRLPRWVELVQVPAESADQPGSLSDQGFSVVDEEPELPVGAVETGRGQVRFALRCAGDRQCVDRVGLAVGAGRVAGVCHQLRGHSND
jgi:hypothetical protein